MKLRLTFARNIKKDYPTDFWKNEISFHLDGVSWAFKTSPYQYAKTNRTRTWRQKKRV